MLSGPERKTGWSLAEHAGEAAPDGMQRLFTTARWDQDLVRGDVRGDVIAALGDPGGVPGGVSRRPQISCSTSSGFRERRIIPSQRWCTLSSSNTSSPLAEPP